MARQLISGCLQLLKDMAAPMISRVLGELESAAYEMSKEEVKAINEVEKGVEKLSSEFTRIQAVLIDAEKREIDDAGVQDWLEKLKDVSFDIDDVLDEWNTAIGKSNIGKEEKDGEDAPPAKKVRLSLSKWFSGSAVLVHDLILRRNIATKIKELNERLDAIAREQRNYNFKIISINDIREPERPKTTSFIDVAKVYGREEEMEIIMSKLMSVSSNMKGLDVIPLVGMGGIGKTTLAQLIYNDDKVKYHFKRRIWICVSDPFDEIIVAKAIIEALNGCASNLVEMQSLLQRIQESVEGQRCLFVLDDVWTDDAAKWEPLKEAMKSSAPGSRVLITTRKKEVAIMMGAEAHMILVKLLSEEMCWSIFRQLAFMDEDECAELEEIGRQIVTKCKGLPLVAKTLGSLMRYRKGIQQWNEVLQSELWELENDVVKKKFFAPFFLSYNDLPYVEKRCLSYCSIFPKDYVMSKDVLIQLWMSQGYLSDSKSREEGQYCFENLASRSFFQDFRKDKIGNIVRCKMHDIMHEFVQFLARNECSIIYVKEEMEYIGKKTRHAMLLPMAVNLRNSFFEARGLRTLFFESAYGLSANSLERLFLNLTCLRALNLSWSKFEQLPEGIEKLIHLRYLDLSWCDHLKELTNSLCDLFNLQTLRLTGCRSLEKLPKDIGRLVNLRHLYIQSCPRLIALPKDIGRLVNLRHLYIRSCPRLIALPKGIAKLSCLETLDCFYVPDYDRLVDSEALELEDLNMLKELRGSLRIEGCGNIVDRVQAERAQIKDKEYFDLELWFGGTCQNGGDRDEVLEALEPHPNIKYLSINYYNGNTISPYWMTALRYLKTLTLSDIFNCEYLPALGKLPSLEILKIHNLFRVERLGVEFYGIENDDNGAHRTHLISFPNLKQLFFHGLPRWEEWELGINSGEEEDDCFTIMPSLQYLEISFCQKLKTLPDFLRRIPLRRLGITGCEILKERCREGVGEEWPKISHVPNNQSEDSFSHNIPDLQCEDSFSHVPELQFEDSFSHVTELQFEDSFSDDWQW